VVSYSLAFRGKGYGKSFVVNNSREMVPEGRLELPRDYVPLRPERSASANSTTPARSESVAYRYSIGSFRSDGWEMFPLPNPGLPF